MRRTLFGSTTTKPEPRLAAVLAYLLWVMSGMLLLMMARQSRFVRFHALQSILYSGAVALALATPLLAGLHLVSAALAGPALGVWLLLIYRAARGEWFQLPGLGWWAERSV